MSRVDLAGAAVAAVLAATTAGIVGCAPAGDRGAAGPPAQVPARQLQSSVADAYSFLSQMMDKYAAGSTPRLVQSFTGGVLGQQHFTASETYDDALLVDAYLAAGTPGGRSRAEVIGNGLLYVQAHDPQHDGRVRAAYSPAPLRSPSDVTVTDAASHVGAMAWAGQALVQLYAATGRRVYLTGAEAIGNWVQAHCHDTRGPGGYTGGESANGQKIEWKSAEHNIDLYAFFSLLAMKTRDPAWSVRAAWARRFVAGVWDARQGRFYIGTTSDGKTPNDSVTPEDVNSWSYLALRDPGYAASVGWDVRNLAASAGGFSGVSFCGGDRTGVWFEGTAHLADALELRGGPGDGARAAEYLSDIYHAQAHGPNSDGLGIISASRNGLSDCGGGSYYASLHTGATAWYILAAGKTDPFFLISGPHGRSLVPAKRESFVREPSSVHGHGRQPAELAPGGRRDTLGHFLPAKLGAGKIGQVLAGLSPGIRCVRSERQPTSQLIGDLPHGAGAQLEGQLRAQVLTQCGR